MGYKGWALFMDADEIFQSDIKKLLALIDNKYAVMCVRHSYTPRPDEVKMDNRAQRYYHRKNWSSFVLWNCGHPKNAAITPERVNFLTGKDLHSFCWLLDSDIGALPFTYNYIPGTSPELGVNVKPDVIHYSDGGPWFPKYRDVTYAEEWSHEFESWQRDGGLGKFSDVPTTRHDFL